jgi:hypothetical protein
MSGHDGIDKPFWLSNLSFLIVKSKLPFSFLPPKIILQPYNIILIAGMGRVGMLPYFGYNTKVVRTYQSMAFAFLQHNNVAFIIRFRFYFFIGQVGGHFYRAAEYPPYFGTAKMGENIMAKNIKIMM